MQGPPIGDIEDAHRAILYPWQWADDLDRPSSAAFRDPVLSVDIKSRTTPAETRARFRGEVKLVEFGCGEARSIGFDTRDEPDAASPDNRAHAHVYCVVEEKRRKGAARRLAEARRLVRAVDARRAPRAGSLSGLGA